MRMLARLNLGEKAPRECCEDCAATSKTFFAINSSGTSPNSAAPAKAPGNDKTIPPFMNCGRLHLRGKCFHENQVVPAEEPRMRC